VARLLAHAVSLTCFLFLSREREAVLSNLSRVRRRPVSLREAYRVFHNFSRFMVAYACLNRFGPPWLLARMDGVPEATHTMEDTLADGHGMILLTMHLGQWDMGLSLLDRLGVPAHVVMRRTDPDGVSKLAGATRGGENLVLHMVGDSPLVGVELMAALLRGEIVAAQADRAAGANVIQVPLFGRPTLLPTGPVRLALATGAPIVPVFTLLGERDRFRLLALEPIRLGRHRGDAIDHAVRDAMPKLASVMEAMIARHDDQWFNFFDVWAEPEAQPETDEEEAHV
jgi:KDO2-lipid IV(A) lauroyltransferase